MTNDRPTINRRYIDATNRMRDEVARERDGSSNLQNKASYENELFDNYAWQKIELEEDKISHDVSQSRRDDLKDGFERTYTGTVTKITIRQPVKHNKDLEEILAHEPSSNSTGPVEGFRYENNALVKEIERVGDLGNAAIQQEIKTAIDYLKTEVAKRNEDLDTQNRGLRENIKVSINRR